MGILFIMHERADKNTPSQIMGWLYSPYFYFNAKFANKEHSLLDIACGENRQRAYLDHEWGQVFSSDYNKAPNVDFVCNALDIKDYLTKVDTVFSFETIEHLHEKEHLRFVENLLDISERHVIIGSVNTAGPCRIDGVDIWTGDKNPFHLKEYSDTEWKTFFDRFASHYEIEYYGVHHYKDDIFVFNNVLKNSISNYVRISK